jgi:hypothetical protein
MLKTIVLTCLAVMLTLTVAPMGMAQAGAPGKYCNDNGNFGFSHDACVVCTAQGDTAVCFCKLALDEGAITQDQFGACVSGQDVGPSHVSGATFAFLLTGAVLFGVCLKFRTRQA